MMTNSPEAPTVKIPQPLANLIVEYAQEKAHVPQCAFPPITSVRGLASEFPNVRGTVEVTSTGNAQVTIDVFVPFGHKIEEGLVQFELEDVSNLFAQFAHVTGRYMSRLDSHTDIRLTHWHWATDQVPIAWVGILHGVDFESSNLILRRGNNSSDNSMRLQGNAVWHLLRKGLFGKRTCLVVVTTEAHDFQDSLIWDDLSALEFVFGAALRLDVLVGVNEFNMPVAAFGPSFGYRFRPETANYPPIPYDQEHAWIAVAFPRLVKVLAEKEPNPVGTAICGYADTTIGHIEGQYLFAQVLLEAVAYQLTTDPRPLVRDVAKWESWAKTVRDKLKEHAVQNDDRALNTLAKKLNELCRPTTSSLVQQTLNRMGLEPPNEALDEIDGRNQVAHTMSMSSDEPRDLEKDLRRIRIIRALLASLALRHIGYEGALADWDRDDSNWPETAEWFTISDSARDESLIVHEADAS